MMVRSGGGTDAVEADSMDSLRYGPRTALDHPGACAITRAPDVTFGLGVLAEP